MSFPNPSRGHPPLPPGDRRPGRRPSDRVHALRALIPPIVRSLEGDGTRLIVVPHETLHQVPFDTLWYRSERLEQRVYVRDGFTTALLPSAAALLLLKIRARTAAQSCWGDLPGAAREARQVADLFGTTPLLGEEAKRAGFLDAAEPLIVHVASHGDRIGDDPLLSGLHLTGGMVTVEADHKLLPKLDTRDNLGEILTTDVGLVRVDRRCREVMDQLIYPAWRFNRGPPEAPAAFRGPAATLATPAAGAAS